MGEEGEVWGPGVVGKRGGRVGGLWERRKVWVSGVVGEEGEVWGL